MKPKQASTRQCTNHGHRDLKYANERQQLDALMLGSAMRLDRKIKEHAGVWGCLIGGVWYRYVDGVWRRLRTGQATAGDMASNWSSN